MEFQALFLVRGRSCDLSRGTFARPDTAVTQDSRNVPIHSKPPSLGHLWLDDAVGWLLLGAQALASGGVRGARAPWVTNDDGKEETAIQQLATQSPRTALGSDGGRVLRARSGRHLHAGTEATAFNPRAAAAVERFAFSVANQVARTRTNRRATQRRVPSKIIRPPHGGPRSHNRRPVAPKGFGCPSMMAVNLAGWTDA